MYNIVDKSFPQLRFEPLHSFYMLGLVDNIGNYFIEFSLDRGLDRSACPDNLKPYADFRANEFSLGTSSLSLCEIFN